MYKDIKVILSFIISFLLFLFNYNIVNANNKGIPYINPRWEEYVKLSDEEKKEYNIAPEKYIVDYVDDSGNVTPFNTYGSMTSTIPSKFNLRDNYATTIYDQGEAGLCWAYSAVETIESNLKVNNVDASFSVKQLDYLTYNKGYENYTYKIYKNPYAPTFWNRTLTDGWLSSSSPYPLLATGVAAITETKFNSGYSVSIGNDKPTYSSTIPTSRYLDNNKIEYVVTEYVDFPVYDQSDAMINIIKEHLMNNGAIYIDSIAPDYRSGDCYNSTYNMIIEKNTCTGATTTGRHAMIIIGWDDNHGGTGAFILQNSWGSLGVDPEDEPSYVFPYLSYDSIINHMHGIKTVVKKYWDNGYDYTMGSEVYYAGNLLTYDASTRYTNARVDTIYDRNTLYKEKLESINFESEVQNGQFNIYVSKNGNVEDTVLYDTVTSEMPGLITYYFDDVILDSDEFVISVEPTTSSSYLVMSVAAHTSIVDNIGTKASVAPQEDIVYQKAFGTTSSSNYVYDFTTHTANISTGSKLTYKIYNSSNTLITQASNTAYVYTREIINDKQLSKLVFSSSMSSDTYRIDVLNGSTIMDSFNLEFNNSITGSGTESDPYIITKASELNNIRTSLDSYYKLGADIDLSNYSDEDGLGWNPIENFTGTLDGNGYKIIGLSINRPDEDYVGLFANTSGGKITNIIFENVNINGKNYVGSIVGNSVTTEINEIEVLNAKVNGTDYVGGIVGKTSGQLYASSVVGNVVSNNIAGGIVGANTSAVIISDTYHIGTVTGANGVGGIIGSAYSGTSVVTSFNVGDLISITTTDWMYFGGIVGKSNNITINYAYNVGNVPSTSNNIAGGIFGYGSSPKVVLNYCYYSGNSTSSTSNGTATETSVAKKTLEEMKQMSSYTGFNSSVWEMKNNNVYPTLIYYPYTFVNEIDTVDSISLGIDSEYILTYGVLPTDAYNKDVKFSSTDENIVEVSDEGIIHTKNIGTAKVIVSSTDGSLVTKEININVIEKGINIKEYNITPSKIYNNKSAIINLSVELRDILSSSLTFKILNSYNQDVTSKFSVTKTNESISGLYSYVDYNITIPANITSGNYTLSIISDDIYESNKVNFIINEYVYVSSIVLNKTNLELVVGKNETLTATINPTNANNKTLTWSSSDTSVATVDQNGLVTAIKRGTAIITVADYDNKVSATSTVTVLNPSMNINSVILSNNINDEKVLYNGYTGNVSIIVSSQDIKDNTNLNISVKNASDVDVTNKFTISGNTIKNNNATINLSASSELTTGKYTINIKTNDISKTYQFNVNSPILVTSINANDVELKLGDTYKIVPTILPDNALNKTVTYKSNNTNIVTIDSIGNITTVGNGTTTIEIKSNDGSNIVKIINVKVNGDNLVLKDDSEYKLLEENKLISNVKLKNIDGNISKVNVSKFVSEFSVFNADIYDKTGLLIENNDEIISTGMEVRTGNLTYGIVVIGDVDGDGDVTTADAYKIVLHAVEKKTLVNYYLNAALIDDDDLATTADAYRIVLFVVGKRNEL